MNTKVDNSIEIIKSEFFRYKESVKRLNFMLNKSNREIEKLEQQLKETQKKLKQYETGFKGACPTCENTGEVNLKLEEIIELLKNENELLWSIIARVDEVKHQLECNK